MCKSIEYYAKDFLHELRKTEKLFEYLKKEIGLEPDKAFEIIYYLQEKMEIIPDTIEMCNKCKKLIHSDIEHMGISNNRILCDWCDSIE